MSWIRPPWLLLALLAAPRLDNPAVVPEPRLGAWLQQHEEFAASSKLGGIDLLFLGDSITALWDTTAPGLWSRYYEPRNAANLAIGGDRTQNLLWRIDHGELDGLRPRVVVLLIGTNNLPEQAEDQVVEGIEAVVDRIRRKLPEARILLLGLPPRGINRDPGQVTTAPDPRVARINPKIARLAASPKLRYLDLGPALLDDVGHLSRSLQPDFLHLSRKGYRAWAEAMEPTLWEMMTE